MCLLQDLMQVVIIKAAKSSFLCFCCDAILQRVPRRHTTPLLVVVLSVCSQDSPQFVQSYPGSWGVESCPDLAAWKSAPNQPHPTFWDPEYIRRLWEGPAVSWLSSAEIHWASPPMKDFWALHQLKASVLQLFLYSLKHLLAQVFWKSAAKTIQLWWARDRLMLTNEIIPESMKFMFCSLARNRWLCIAMNFINSWTLCNLTNLQTVLVRMLRCN